MADLDIALLHGSDTAFLALPFRHTIHTAGRRCPALHLK
jgi:hypothetical protein